MGTRIEVLAGPGMLDIEQSFKLLAQRESTDASAHLGGDVGEGLLGPRYSDGRVRVSG